MTNIYWEEHNRAEEGGEKKELEEASLTCSIELPKKEIGGYDITGNQGGNYSVIFWMTKKPNWFHRICTRLFLGWDWVDKK